MWENDMQGEGTGFCACIEDRISGGIRTEYGSLGANGGEGGGIETKGADRSIWKGERDKEPGAG